MKQTRNIARHSFASILSVLVATLILNTIALAQVTPRWIPTGSMNTPRSGHTATLLPNGKVLVVGGDSSGSAELYDPVIGSWNFTGSLNIPPGGHTATLLPNGKVLVVGDFNDRAELYDPATETWTVTGALNAGPRPDHTATLLPDGQVLVVAGGDPDIGGNILDTGELYDPSSGMWRIAGSLNTGRIGHTTTLLPDGMVLVAGGWGAVFRSHNSAQFGVLSGAELYEPATGTSFVTLDLNTPRMGHTATRLPNGKVLVAGGDTKLFGGQTNGAELYDRATGTWTITGNLSTVRSAHTATLLPDGKVLFAGGHVGSFPFTNISNSELYDPATATWSVTASLNTARSGHTATLLPNGKVLVAGGRNATSSLNTAELYDSTSTLVAAVLPSSRSVQVGTPATAFATIINTDSNTATGCTISPITSIPATFTYQTTDPATNQVTGFGNTPVDLPAGAVQSFVFALIPTARMDPTDVQLSFDCANSDPAPIISGLNTFLFSASATPVADILALVATPNNDGIVNIPGTASTGVFAVATVNMGAGDTLTVAADTGRAILPVTIFICQTDPQTGVCFAQPESSVTTMILSNETPTFGVFVAAAGDVSFVPETNRIFVRFKDSSNVTRGLTSVAVRTQ
jgi:WD40 repeat protein